LYSSIDRSRNGRIGALVLHSRYNARETAAPGRAKAAANLDARLLAEIDERDPGLPEAERMRRLDYARRAHFARLALRSAQSRRRKEAQNAS
jgi:hypothetical protein